MVVTARPPARRAAIRRVPRGPMSRRIRADLSAGRAGVPQLGADVGPLVLCNEGLLGALGERRAD